VDEAGRGPLAGPVVAAAVVLGDVAIDGIADSKRLSAIRRSELSEIIKRDAVAWCIAESSPAEIDTINILQATLQAMQRAVSGLSVLPSLVQVDGNKAPELPVSTECVIRGDAKVAAIGAASILAKVHRDAMMQRYDEQYPDYGFAGHKGYPTKAHMLSLQRLGPCPIHRRSFAPVAACLTTTL
jgi:ribonuclease HII